MTVRLASRGADGIHCRRDRDYDGKSSEEVIDYEVWLEKVCSRLHPAPHAPIEQAGPEAGCTTAPAKLASGKPLS
jgi:hypothetical protein